MKGEAMKTTLKGFTQCLLLMAAFVAVESASAFYDAGLGRWINRDPIGENGGWNLTEFCRNNPVSYFDKFGLWVVGPPARDINTVVCDGNGGIRIQISGNAPGPLDCIIDCLRAHEQEHINQIQRAAPGICQGQPPGTTVRFSDPTEQAVNEVRASEVELNCLRSLDKRCPARPSCDSTIASRIRQMEEYRDRFRQRLPVYP